MSEDHQKTERSPLTMTLRYKIKQISYLTSIVTQFELRIAMFKKELTIIIREILQAAFYLLRILTIFIRG